MARALEDQAIDVIPRPESEQVIRFEPSLRRVRAIVAGVTIADSTQSLLALEKKRLPVYYFPDDGVRKEFLSPAGYAEQHPHRGEATYWSITVGERVAERAAWSYPDPEAPELRGRFAFYWNKMDAWFEEDDEVFAHPRDPYHRVDVLTSSRHVRVIIGGEVVAETHRPRLLLETGLPTRYYIPKVDVRMELLTPTMTRTRCPYKGEASYWSVTAGGKEHKDIVWSYPAPIPEIPKIENLLCFYNERVDAIAVDGELQPKPITPWSYPVR